MMTPDDTIVPSDEALAAIMQEGGRAEAAEALAQLVERYEPKITRYANKFLHTYEDRQDAVQEVFIKVYQNIRSFRTKERFSPWVYRVAHNTFLNFIKKQKREHISTIDADQFFSWSAADEGVHKDHEQKLDRDMLDACLGELDVKYREVLVLYYFEEKNYKEIADIVRIPVATVGVRLKRGRDKMQAILTKHGIS